jgi:hypothetical protein
MRFLYTPNMTGMVYGIGFTSLYLTIQNEFEHLNPTFGVDNGPSFHGFILNMFSVWRLEQVNTCSSQI